MHPSNSLMDGSAIGSALPVFGIPVATFGTITQRGKLQTLIPIVSEEGTSPMCTLLFSCIFLLFLPIHLFFISSLFLFVLMFLVALLFLLTLPFVEENTRSHPGFRGFTHFYLTTRKARLFLVNPFKCDLSSGINSATLLRLFRSQNFHLPFLF
jgi:hypothetical protein